jgi:protein gp37
MAIASAIEWTEATWNPVGGCTILSPGCTNCYAMRMASRLEAMGQHKYQGTTRMSGGRAKWTGKVVLDERALQLPHSWKKGRLIFVNSMSDLFHEAVPVSFVQRVFQVMEDTPWPAPGSEDTELGVLMELEVGHGETEVHAGVQA